MIIGLSGYSGSGKDEIAKILISQFGYRRVAFADNIRNIIYDLNPVVMVDVNYKDITIKDLVDRDGWDITKKNKEVRRLLQFLGEASRRHLNENIWVDSALSLLDSKENIVITDVRYVNEITFIKNRFLNSQVWRVKRTNVSPVNGHISETELEHYKVDQILQNNGSLEDLRLLVKTRMRGFI